MTRSRAYVAQGDTTPELKASCELTLLLLTLTSGELQVLLRYHCHLPGPVMGPFSLETGCGPPDHIPPSLFCSPLGDHGYVLLLIAVGEVVRGQFHCQSPQCMFVT